MKRISKSDLTPKKQALLQQLIQSQGLGLSTSPKIPVREDRSRAPLSYAQQGIWFINELEPGSPVYNDHFALRLTGPVNDAALEQGLNEIVNRHEALRTTFKIVDREPVQVIARCLSLTIPVFEVSGLDGNAPHEMTMELAVAEARRPFDLESGPLIRMTLLKFSGEECLLVFTIHHLVSDGWSLGIFTKELATLYDRFVAGSSSVLPALPIQYGDYARWQKTWVEESVRALHLPYWKEKLAGSRPALDLPLDHSRPESQSYNGTRESLHIPPQLNRKLKSFSQQNAGTVFMLLAAAFKALLYRYTGETDILIGNPVAGRHGSETEGLIGVFVNTIILRTGLSGELSFKDLHARVRETALSAFDRQDLPFEILVEELNPDRGLSRNPLFQVAFAFQNEPARELRLPGLTLERLNIDAGTAKFDLTLDFIDSGQNLIGALEYNTDLFEAATIRRMAGHLLNLLEGAVSHPERRLCELPMLSQAGRQQVMVEWNDTHSKTGAEQSVHEAFDRQAQLSPDAVALVSDHLYLTYSELYCRANQLARHLIRIGVKPDLRVAVCLQRSSELVIALLGALKAGGAYVPLDPAYPSQRLNFMLADARPHVLLTHSRLSESFSSSDAHVLCLDKDWARIEQEDRTTPGVGLTSQNLAYVIYTSGSTGQPKEWR